MTGVGDHPRRRDDGPVRRRDLPPRHRQAGDARRGRRARSRDGAIVALGGGLCARLPMALVRELVRPGRDELHVVGSAHSIDVDLLVAAGAVGVCEESYVGFEQDLGLAPAYRRAAEAGAVEVRESCCVDRARRSCGPRRWGCRSCRCAGVKGTDMEALHPEYRRVRCPFTGDELVAVPPLRPDVALLHAPIGDAAGNLHLDQPYVLDERFAHASRPWSSPPSTGWCRRRRWSRPASPSRGTRVARGRRGAVRRAPGVLLPGLRATTARTWPAYVAAAAAGGDQLASYLDRYVHAGEDAYRARDRRRPGSRRWYDVATTAWQELFRMSLDARRVVRRRAGPHHRRPRGRLPRLREPVRAGGHARREADPRPGIAAGRGRHLRGRPGARVHPADQQRPGAAPRRGLPDAVRGVLRRGLPRGGRPDVPVRWADRRLRQHQRHRRSAGCRTRRSSSAAGAAAATSRRPSAR